MGCTTCSNPADIYDHRTRSMRCASCVADHGRYEAGSSSAAFAAALLALVPVGLVLSFVARLAGAVAGVA